MCRVGQKKVKATIPEAAIRPSSGTFGLPVARTAKIRPSLVRMYVPKKKTGGRLLGANMQSANSGKLQA